MRSTDRIGVMVNRSFGLSQGAGVLNFNRMTRYNQPETILKPWTFNEDVTVASGKKVDGVDISVLPGQPTICWRENVSGSATFVLADFIVPAGKTLKILSLGSLYLSAADKTVKVRNVTDAVDVDSTTNVYKASSAQVATGKQVQLQLINGNVAAQIILGQVTMSIE